MDTDHDEFGALRRLLALKRHEQPPPGYFENFSRKVLVRLQAEAEAKPGWRAWVQNLFTGFENRPALAGAFGFAVCAFLATGFLSSDTPPSSPLLANSAIFEAPYQISSTITPTGDTNGPRHEVHRASLFEEMRANRNNARVQMINWRP